MEDSNARKFIVALYRACDSINKRSRWFDYQIFFEEILAEKLKEHLYEFAHYFESFSPMDFLIFLFLEIEELQIRDLENSKMFCDFMASLFTKLEGDNRIRLISNIEKERRFFDFAKEKKLLAEEEFANIDNFFKLRDAVFNKDNVATLELLNDADWFDTYLCPKMITIEEKLIPEQLEFNSRLIRRIRGNPDFFKDWIASVKSRRDC